MKGLDELKDIVGGSIATAVWDSVVDKVSFAAYEAENMCPTVPMDLWLPLNFGVYAAVTLSVWVHTREKIEGIINE